MGKQVAAGMLTKKAREPGRQKLPVAGGSEGRVLRRLARQPKMYLENSIQKKDK